MTPLRPHTGPGNEEAGKAIQVLPGLFSIIRLPPGSAIPSWVGGSFYSVTGGRQELSIVCPEDLVPSAVMASRNWVCLQVRGPLDLKMVGLLANLTGALAAAGINLFAVSTYDTDYLLLPAWRLEKACTVLREAGYAVHAPGSYSGL